MTHSILKINNDEIAYHKITGDKTKPFVVFLSGFRSDMEGTKAVFLESVCKDLDYGYVRFDYFGHGKSSRKFTDCNISIWKQNCLDVINNLTENRELIIIGSSMGGWLMILTALKIQDRLKGLIGIASAPDFTEDLILQEFSEAQKRELYKKGLVNLESEYSDEPYLITKDLIEDGGKNLVLKGDININCPVRLLHGKNDMDVPTSCSTKLAEKLTSQDVTVNLIDGADHRMSSDEALAVLRKAFLNLK